MSHYDEMIESIPAGKRKYIEEIAERAGTIEASWYVFEEAATMLKLKDDEIDELKDWQTRAVAMLREKYCEVCEYNVFEDCEPYECNTCEADKLFKEAEGE